MAKTDAGQPPTADMLWKAVVARAQAQGLNTDKFVDGHRAVVDDIAAFLAADVQEDRGADSAEISRNPLRRLFQRKTAPPAPTPVAPIILFGEPGTGKTTFLYIIDALLRDSYGYPDNLESPMRKASGRSHHVQKRQFDGQPLTLLSVRKWAELLHFFEWDTQRHKLDADALDAFVRSKLLPMRVIFADEVELVGYAPTIPELASHGILVVGTSNQTTFRQLETADLHPRLYEFAGGDMRKGDPEDAIIRPNHPLFPQFDAVRKTPQQRFEQLVFHVTRSDDSVLMLIDFQMAVNAPLLETEWITLFQDTWRQASAQTGLLDSAAKFVLLLDHFTLETIRTNFNAVMRYILLLDAVEQLNIGVKLRHPTEAIVLSREALDHMRVTMYTAPGVADEIKQKALAGIDRATSRIGQAGARADQILGL